MLQRVGDTLRTIPVKPNLRPIGVAAIPCRGLSHASRSFKNSLTCNQHQAIHYTQDKSHVLQKSVRAFQKNTYCFQHGSAKKMAYRAFIALGSNMGDRVAMIEQACHEMEARGKVKIKRTSSLWETKAMYVLDQDKFLNGACEVSSHWSGCILVLIRVD